MANVRKRMNVISLSFDDCVYHYDYNYAKAPRDVNEATADENPFDSVPNVDPDRLKNSNQTLIKSIAHQVSLGNFQEVVTMVGCTRQDKEIEVQRNAKFDRGLCAVDLRVLTGEIKKETAGHDVLFRMDGYLLADTYGILANEDKASELVRNEIGCEIGVLAAASGVININNNKINNAERSREFANRQKAAAISRVDHSAGLQYSARSSSNVEEINRLQALNEKNLARLREATGRLSRLFLPAYSTRSLGDTFREMDPGYFNDFEAVADNVWHDDGSNYILYYDKISNARDRDSIANITLDLCDDRLSVRHEILNFFIRNPGLMPGNIVMPKVQAALRKQDEDFIHAQWFMDESKLTVLYAEMHKLASENPEADIVFDFYDGRREIVQALWQFFSSNRDLIPGNIELRLHEYSGKQPIDSAPVTGRGAIDYNYHHNTRLLVEKAGFNYYLQGYHAVAPSEPTDTCPHVGVMAGYFNQPARLKAFKKERRFLNDVVEKEYAPQVYSLGAFDPQLYLRELYDGIHQLEDNDKTAEFKHALNQLYALLAEDLADSVRKGVLPKKIAADRANSIAKTTSIFLAKLNTIKSREEGISTINQFVKEYERNQRWRGFFKVLAVIAALALGLVVTAAIGVAVIFSAGALTAPVIAGVAAGSATLGLGSAALTGCLLFKPDPKEKALKSVVKTVKNILQNEEGPSESTSLAL